MTRFLTHKYVLAAEIKKRIVRFGCRNTNVFPTHFLAWRSEPATKCILSTKNCHVRRRDRVIPGDGAACLKKLSEEEASNFPEVCQALSRDFYVDDFLGGATSKQAALQLHDDLIIILKRAGLEHYASNDPYLLFGAEAEAPGTNNELDLHCTENVTTVLGLYCRNKEIYAYQYNFVT